MIKGISFKNLKIVMLYFDFIYVLDKYLLNRYWIFSIFLVIRKRVMSFLFFCGLYFR